MTEQGWSDQKGLGPDESGIPQPIKADIQGLAVWRRRPPGLGYQENAVDDTSTNSNDQGKTPKTVEESAVAWNAYAGDPCAGDQTAKQAYVHGSATDKESYVGSAQGVVASANTSVEIITSGRHVFRDEWKPTPTRMSTPRAHAQTSSRTRRNGSATPPSITYNFVPCSSDNNEGW